MLHSLGTYRRCNKRWGKPRHHRITSNRKKKIENKKKKGELPWVFYLFLFLLVVEAHGWSLGRLRCCFRYYCILVSMATVNGFMEIWMQHLFLFLFKFYLTCTFSPRYLPYVYIPIYSRLPDCVGICRGSFVTAGLWGFRYWDIHKSTVF